MTATQWHFGNLRDVCRKKGIPDPTEHLIALSWRWKRGDFHADMATEMWNDLLGQSFTVGDNVYQEHVFAYEAHVEACVCCLHSLSDLIAQVINDVVLNRQLGEHNVSMHQVISLMDSQGVADEVQNRSETFTASNEFGYVEAFCNTLKHRLLVKADFHGEFGGEYRNEMGIRFQSFRCKGRLWPMTWGSDILRDKRAEIAELVVRIGLSLDDYVASIP